MNIAQEVTMLTVTLVNVTAGDGSDKNCRTLHSIELSYNRGKGGANGGRT